MRSRHLFRSAALIALGTAVLLSLFVGVARSPQALAAGPTRAGAIARSAAGSSQLAATPPMGFNTWNAFGCRINEATVHAIADTMVADGLRDAGYHFVNLDDCWGAATRNGAGELEANHTRFAHGMKALGAYLHARNFGFGIYGDAGTHTCKRPGGALFVAPIKKGAAILLGKRQARRAGPSRPSW